VKALTRPARLKPGARIALVAPGSAPAADRLAEGIAYLTARGYDVRPHPSIPAGRAYLSATDSARALAIQESFADPEVDAIFCIAGGYGAVRTLPLLNWEAIAKTPKIFLGYSDVTALHLALNQRVGLVTFHGPLVATTMHKPLSPLTANSLWQALASDAPAGVLPPPAKGLTVLAPGRAKGPLLAGNLSVLCSMLGGPFAPDTTGKVLFLEETSEHPCRLDELLSQFKMAGLFQKAAGIVFARLHRCHARDPGWPVWDPVHVLQDAFRDLGRPVLYGLEFGHTARKLTLPCGVRVELDTDPPRICITETATA
jgi:muramoyltetrapeptide carboxypeptidase